MKSTLTLTLISAFACSFAPVFSQVQQNFETVSSLEALQQECWQFSNISLSDQNKVYDVKSLAAAPVMNSNDKASISTPFINLVAGSNISFAYRLNSSLASGATRTVRIYLQDIDGSLLPVDSFTLNSSTPTSIFTFSKPSPVSGIRRVLIDIRGKADGNGHLYFDNFMIDGSYNYNTPYNCFSPADIPLIVQIKSFQGYIQDQKTFLTWEVGENHHGAYFEIQRSHDGRSFKTIDNLFVTRKKQDESYRFIVDYRFPAYYRLKCTHKSGDIFYSSVLFTKAKTLESPFILLQNPVTNTLWFSFLSDGSQNSVLTIYDVHGNALFRSPFFVQKGYNRVSKQIDKKLKSGIYILEVKTSSGSFVEKCIINN